MDTWTDKKEWPHSRCYVGEVDDIYHKKVNEFGRCYESSWAKRRVYGDEMPLLSSIELTAKAQSHWENIQ